MCQLLRRWGSLSRSQSAPTPISRCVLVEVSGVCPNNAGSMRAFLLLTKTVARVAGGLLDNRKELRALSQGQGILIAPLYLLKAQDCCTVVSLD